MSDPKLHPETCFSHHHRAFPDLETSLGALCALSNRSSTAATHLGPNGSDAVDWTVTVVDASGQPMAGIEVRFDVRAVYPLGDWRSLDAIKEQFGRSQGWRDKRLLGTVSPVSVITDAEGQATTRYTASHVAGDDPSRKGEEQVVARLANGDTTSATIHLGYTHLREVKAIRGGLVFAPTARGRWAHRQLAGFLEDVGHAIRRQGWPQPLVLTNLSYPWGGLIPPHSGHLHGLSIDARPLSTNGGPTWAGQASCPKTSDQASNYDRQRMQTLARALAESGATRFFFNDLEIPETTCVPFHHHHVHVSWLSPQAADTEYQGYEPVEEAPDDDLALEAAPVDAAASVDDTVSTVDTPIQRDTPRFRLGTELAEVDALVKAAEARARFNVNGESLTVAVLDTGLNTAHVDFLGRIPVQRNYTADNNGDPNNAWDGNGHGTNVAGIIVANEDHIGIAPQARVVPIKVLGNAGGGSFTAILDALRWIHDNHEAFGISTVCMSLGGAQNYQTDELLGDNEVARAIAALKKKRIAVVIAAGNDFYRHDSQEGMSFPAIIRDCISVGAVYDNNEGGFSYQSGAVAFSTGTDRITPFSQRLHPTTNPFCYTDIFAPGAPVTSSGINGPNGESVQQGTSQATPVTCGVVLLAQEFYQRATGKLPDIDDLIDWIRSSGVAIFDGDDEDDNVINTQKEYLRIDAVSLLSQIKSRIEVQDLLRQKALLPCPR